MHDDIILWLKPTICTISQFFFFVKKSTRFGQTCCPSSAVCILDTVFTANSIFHIASCHLLHILLYHITVLVLYFLGVLILIRLFSSLGIHEIGKYQFAVNTILIACIPWRRGQCGLHTHSERAGEEKTPYSCYQSNHGLLLFHPLQNHITGAIPTPLLAFAWPFNVVVLQKYTCN